MSIATGIVRLGPANPILLRVVTAAGKRLRHAFIRWGYLALLIAVLLISLLGSSQGLESNLGELAKASTQVFKYISYVQLTMICLLAPIFTASAITSERDSRTYNILLATPLSNGQIVLGSLLSRLYFVIALLLSGVPVFAITLFYGGVTAQSIVMSFAIALTTGLFTGSLAITIAVLRLGTGKTVFWFYVFNAVYLVGIYMIDVTISPAITTSTGVAVRYTTWLTGIHPFLALMSVVNPSSYDTPDVAGLGRFPLLIRWYLAYPAYAYLTLTMVASMVMVGPSAILLRRISQRTELTLWQYLMSLVFKGSGERTRRSHSVWTNPVAWREAVTKAGVSARGITRWVTIVIGIIAAIALLIPLKTGDFFGASFDETDARKWLLGLIIMEFAVSLLVAINSSASAVTKERESQTLDLLLVTPITSRYYIWGKLRGLVSFMLPFAAVPSITILLVVGFDLIRGELFGTRLVVFPEVVILLPIYLTAMLAFTCMLGLQLSLKWSRTLMAVMGSVAVLAGIMGGLGACGTPAAANIQGGGPVIGAFSPFTAITLMVDPLQFAGKSFGGSGHFEVGETYFGQRLAMGLALLTASGVACLIVWGMYKSMVRNFDMIIRRQHQ